MFLQMSRRSFIRTGTAFGVGSMAAASITTPLTAAEAKKTNHPDIAVVNGMDYYTNTQKAVELLGGIKRFVPKGVRVALLINSAFRNPGTIVNPTIALAVLKMCFDAEAKEVYWIPGSPSGYWQRSTKAEELKEIIAAIKTGSGTIRKDIAKGVSLKSAEIDRYLLECDVLINIPICKDHAGTHFTGNLKNMMGACPHSTCRYFHSGSGAKSAYEDVDFLSQCIADLNLIKKPSLCIVDATEFITTNGPFGPGTIKKSQKIVAGCDPVLVDSYCCSLMGLEAKNVVMIRKAYEHQLGLMDLPMAQIQEI